MPAAGVFAASRQKRPSDREESLSLLRSGRDAGHEASTSPKSDVQMAASQGRLVLLRLSVEGMTCGVCSGHCEQAILGVEGVKSASVALLQSTAKVVFDPAVTDEKRILEAVDDAGFDAAVTSKQDAPARPGPGGGPPLSRAAEPGKEAPPLSSVTLEARTPIGGMSCAACVSSAESALRSIPGVASAAVSLLPPRAALRFDPDRTGPRAFVAALDAAGFDAAVASRARAFGSSHAAEVAMWRRACLTAALFTFPAFLAMWLGMFCAPLGRLLRLRVWRGATSLGTALKLCLITPVQFGVGMRFHVGAWRSLRRGSATMDTLVSMGTNAAYFASFLSILHCAATGHELGKDFFETSGMIISFVLFGKFLEASARGRTGDAITRLLQLTPPTALLVAGFAAEDAAGGGAAATAAATAPLTEAALLQAAVRSVDAALVQRGDVLRVLPGSRVPADGAVVAGSSYVDESMITGESAPVPKRPGDAAIGGTVNLRGVLHIRAARVGADASVAQIAALVEAAQLAKAPIQGFADRVSAFFVPSVLLLSCLILCLWWSLGRFRLYPRSWLPEGETPFMFALLFAIATLVTACPCALGLATPTAVMVGTGVGAANGILIKGGDALERCCGLRCLVFDKTGTLTEGRPAVTGCLPCGGLLPEAEALRFLAAAEVGSEHPLAGALLAYCRAVLAPGTLEEEEEEEEGAGTSGGGAAAAEAAGASSSSSGGGGAAGGAWDDFSGDVGSAGGLFAAAGDDDWGASRVGAGACGGGSGRGAGGWAGSTPKGGSTAWLGAAGVPSAEAGEAVAGQGVRCRVHGARVAAGNRALMRAEGVAVPDSAERWLSAEEGRCRTSVCLAVDGALAAVLSVSDPLRPEASGVVAALRQMGLHVCLVSGDNLRTARAVAEEVGIAAADVTGEVSPQGKTARIRELQARFGPAVGMVGDGINDSPALVAADVGVAVGAGTDIAIEAADFVLMRSNLEDVLAAVDLSRKTLRRIRINYVWALIYNMMAVPIAGGALYPHYRLQIPPWVAGAAMMFSSVSVVCSSLELRRYKRPRPVRRIPVALQAIRVAAQRVTKQAPRKAAVKSV